MDEFSLIDDIVSRLGAAAHAAWVDVGPGDDASVVSVGTGGSVVSSIDTFSPGIHFPREAPAEWVGYRCFMAAASDLAAMAAEPRYALVALSLPDRDATYALALCEGLAEAADTCGMAVCGGNLTRAPLSMTVSVHGEVQPGMGVLRSTAQANDLIQVSGQLGGAAACVRLNAFQVAGTLRDAYFRPRARLDLREPLALAHSAIDVSDGCLQDLSHILQASHVGAEIDSRAIPVADGATLDDALWGGDDYELLITAPKALPGFEVIGVVSDNLGIKLDGQEVLLNDVASRGYDHFRS